ncbi:MAG: LPS assembly lipoprotein LptE [Rhodomicrobium sp.]
MWWRELAKHNRRFRGAAALALAAIVSLGAGGCGIHPLYGPTASGADLSEVMKTVDIATIPSRPGQRLRNELIFGTTGGGAASAPIYRLDVAITRTVRNTLVTQQGAATGQIMQLDAEYRLVRIKDNEVVFKAYSTAQASYNLVGATGLAGSTYGDTRAAIDAENRAARSLADTMKTRLAAYLSNAA